MQIIRQTFFSVETIVQSVTQKLEEAARKNQPVDFLTFVPEGEPTLDENLEAEIEALKSFGYPIAVITNGTLLVQPEVRQALIKADWVSLKIDSVIDDVWHKINRPYHRIELDQMLDAMLDFAQEYRGELVTETMLLAGINDGFESTQALAHFLCRLQPYKAYLAIPIRPTTEIGVLPPEGSKLKQIHQIVQSRVPTVQFLVDTEEDHFISTGDLTEDILSIISVHPLREEALRDMVALAGADWAVVESLLTARKIKCILYRRENFYIHTYLTLPQNQTEGEDEI